jgi:hypothetical protein
MHRNICQNAENINLARLVPTGIADTPSLGGTGSVTGPVAMPVTALSQRWQQLPEFEGRNGYKARSGPPLPYVPRLFSKAPG